MSFRAVYSPLCNAHPPLGEVAVLPWDEHIFGFRVGELRPAASPSTHEALRSGHELRDQLLHWATDEDVMLISARTKPTDHSLRILLVEAGFEWVEQSLQVMLPRLRNGTLPQARLNVRLADPKEHAVLDDIAATAFSSGRYHADPRFPKELADRRYRWWLKQALREPTDGTRIYVIGPADRPTGFLHAEINGALADIRLAAVTQDSKRNMGITGVHLYLSTLHVLAEDGVRRVVAQVSAANTPVMNIYSSLGFQFTRPEYIFHWHRPGTGERYRRLAEMTGDVQNSNPSIS